MIIRKGKAKLNERIMQNVFWIRDSHYRQSWPVGYEVYTAERNEERCTIDGISHARTWWVELDALDDITPAIHSEQKDEVIRLWQEITGQLYSGHISYLTVALKFGYSVTFQHNEDYIWNEDKQSWSCSSRNVFILVNDDGDFEYQLYPTAYNVLCACLEQYFLKQERLLRYAIEDGKK